MQIAMKPSETPEKIIPVTESSEKSVQRVPIGKFRDFFRKKEGIEIFSEYGITKEDINKLVQFLEDFTGLAISERVKKGDLTISVLKKSKKAPSKEEEQFQSVLCELGSNKESGLKVGEFTYSYKRLLKFYKDLYRDSRAISEGFYEAEENRIYIIKESIEEFMEYIGKKLLESKIFRDRKEVEKFFVLSLVSHELVHQLVTENNPIFGRNFKDEAELFKLFIELSKADKKRMEEITKQIERISENSKPIKAVDEAIAITASSQFMYKMDYLLSLGSKIRFPVIEEGIIFLAEVERIANCNPIPLVVENPPNSMDEIKHPEKYIQRRRIGSGKNI